MDDQRFQFIWCSNCCSVQPLERDDTATTGISMRVAFSSARRVARLWRRCTNMRTSFPRSYARATNVSNSAPSAHRPRH